MHSPETAVLEFAEQLTAMAIGSGEAGFAPFAAGVIRAGRVLSAEVNRSIQDSDPTAHAEVLAIRAAAMREGTMYLPGATLVTTAFPCPMCLAAVYWAQIPSVSFISTLGRGWTAGLPDAALYRLIQDPMSGPVSIRELKLPGLDSQIAEHFRRRTEHRPGWAD